MTLLADIFAPWSKPLVWTLLHSLWQGLLILTMLMLTLRVIPSAKSSIRYLATTIALSLIFLSSVVTYFYLSAANSSMNSLLISFDTAGSQVVTDPVAVTNKGLLDMV